MVVKGVPPAKGKGVRVLLGVFEDYKVGSDEKCGQIKHKCFI